MKKKFCLILVLSVLFSCTSFAGTDKLIGKWKLLKKEGYFIEFLDKETMISYEGSRKLTITCKPIKDNLFKFKVMGRAGVCKFILDGDNLFFTTEYDCALKGNKYQRIK